MRLFVTGGTGVIGRAFLPAADAAGHTLAAPTHTELDLFDAAPVTGAVAGSEAILHLATRIPPPTEVDDLRAWAENDRLRTEASRILVDAALAAGVAVYVQPTVTFGGGLRAEDRDRPRRTRPGRCRRALRQPRGGSPGPPSGAQLDI